MTKRWLQYWLVWGVATLFTLTGCEPEETDESSRRDDTPRVADEPLPFSTTADHLTVKVEDGTYRPLFIRGMNLGVAVPGTHAGQLAATREDYDRWLNLMGEIGINVLRIYTLHYPRFYEALDDYNRNNPERPIYLLHGIWLDEEMNTTGDLFDLTTHFELGILEVVDCAHGNCSIGERPGRAWGEFEVDVSPWILGWIMGREIHPEEVLITNDANSHLRSFDGEAFRVEDGEALEVWFARHLDNLVRYERSFYGVERPVSVSSWPTLDPLDHKTEGSDYSDEDIATFGLLNIEVVDAPGGIFATYHAYPYYPDYIVDDPDYRQFEDEEGPNSYLGYLLRLKSHYSEIPLFIGEIGVSSSWLSAHWGYENMDHGGHTEVSQGQAGARLMRTVHSANTAGGAFFAWIDEWWKPTWITDPLDYPLERRAHWHNVTGPEQNFGLIAFDVAPPEFDDFAPAQGSGAIRSVEKDADAAYFHVRLHLDRPLTDEDELVIGFDTYRDDLGESILPDGVQTTNRNEFALVIRPGHFADLHVTLAYDLFGRRFNNSDEGQLYQSTATDGEPWRLVRWQNGQPRGSNDGQYWFEATFHDIGHLTMRGHNQPATSHDAVVLYPTRVDIRIPWTLLHVADPGFHRVVHHDRDNHSFHLDTTETEGIALSVTLNEELIVETDRYLWEEWDLAPPTTERIKEGMPYFQEGLEGLPYWVE